MKNIFNGNKSKRENMFKLVSNFIFKSTDNFNEVNFTYWEKEDDIGKRKSIMTTVFRGKPAKEPCFSKEEISSIVEGIFEISYKKYELIDITLWLKDYILEKNTKKTIIGYKIKEKGLVNIYDEIEGIPDGDIFYDNNGLINLINELGVEVTEENICTFDADMMDSYLYASFIKRFDDMTGENLNFTDIEVADFDEMEDLGFGESKITVNFKINEKLESISINFDDEWFNEEFIYKLNQKLIELGNNKYFYFANNETEGNIIYASPDDIKKINEAIEKDGNFINYNKFIMK